jgi:hypothetical protein
LGNLKGYPELIRTILTWLTGGFLDRALDTVDKKIESETDREKIKGDIIREHIRNKADWMRSGGFILMLLFAIPLSFWFAAVVVYSVFWCAGCAFPQTWTIAALPAPLNEWAGIIIISIFGVVGLYRLKH